MTRRNTEAARDCLHSSCVCNRLPLQPDYTCNKDRREHDGKGPRCVLMTLDSCPHHEHFPDSYNA